MKEYTIEITEILQRIIKIKANSEEEAYNKVLSKYNECEIILDSNDFKSKEIVCIS